MVGFVMEYNIQTCKNWLVWCLKQGETFDYEHKYPEEYLRAVGFY